MNSVSSDETIEQRKTADHDAWWVFQRVQEVRSAFSVNVVRTIAVLAFYGIHLANYWSIEDPSEFQQRVHLFATLVFVGWIMLSVAVFASYAIRYLPPSAKYYTTICDVMFLTTAMGIGAKANSWLVIVYLLIIASAVSRFDMKLILLATGLSLAGYLSLVGMADSKWFDSNHETPLPQVFVVLISIGIAGAIGLQCCWSCKSWMLQTSSVTLQTE